MDEVRLRARLMALAASQSGFPRIVSVVSEPQQTRMVLGVSAGLDWFRGHFPGRPILPGVVQLHWAVLVCRAVHDLDESPREIKRLKFRRMIEPPAEVELVVSVAGADEARFEFVSGGHQSSEGTIVFRATAAEAS